MTIHYLTKPTRGEPLSIETALERDLKRSIVAVNAVKAAEAAKEADRARWLREIVTLIRVERARVEVARAALAEASKGDFKNVAAIFVTQQAMGDLIEAQDRLLLAHGEFFTITNGRK